MAGGWLNKAELAEQIWLQAREQVGYRDLSRSAIKLIPYNELYARWRRCQCGSHKGNLLVVLRGIAGRIIEIRAQKKVQQKK